MLEQFLSPGERREGICLNFVTRSQLWPTVIVTVLIICLPKLSRPERSLTATYFTQPQSHYRKCCNLSQGLSAFTQVCVHSAQPQSFTCSLWRMSVTPSHEARASPSPLPCNQLRALRRCNTKRDQMVIYSPALHFNELYETKTDYSQNSSNYYYLCKCPSQTTSSYRTIHRLRHKARIIPTKRLLLKWRYHDLGSVGNTHP